jgi:hypothetical protein
MRHLLAAVACLVCVAVLGACTLASASTGPDPHLLAVQRLGAYRLRYPGAVLLHAGAAPPHRALNHLDGAQTEETFGIHAPVPPVTTPGAILSWYGMQLQAQGWMPVYRPSSPQFEVQQVWVMGNYETYVDIYAPDQMHAYEPTVDPAAYTLVFQVQIIEVNVQA